MKKPVIFFLIIVLSLSVSAQVKLNVDARQDGKAISKDLLGVFFEDINYAADGGIYAELIQNRSFEYFTATDPQNGRVYVRSNPLDAWILIQEGGAKASMKVIDKDPLNGNNTKYLELQVRNAGEAAGVKNLGFSGIPLEAGEKYKFSIYLKKDKGDINAVTIGLRDSDGQLLGSTMIEGIKNSWKKFESELGTKKDVENAELWITTDSEGILSMDMVSLFPEKTYQGRENGLREDLAVVIEDLEPNFFRFPGGCVSHGRGIDNMYRWKETIGDPAERTPNWNLWGYHQTYGLGFYEYFLFCEDLGAKPLPVVPVGISCQFRRREIVPMDEMQPFVDDALDLVEFANGDPSTEWGKKRAEMGHPEPFNMEYICLGNEEDDMPEFRERFNLIAAALREKYPEIKIIGTSGVTHSGSHYESLWEFSREEEIDAVDEHYYVNPNWLLQNTHRYDDFDRNGPKVFLGEWASQDDRLFNAIAEAAYMTGLERNADIVEFACYAPLLINETHPSPWRPDLIRFDNNQIAKTPSYYTQQLFSQYSGDTYLPSELEFDENLTAGMPYKGKSGVGSWNTQVKFRDFKLSSGGQVLYSKDFTEGADLWEVISGDFNLEAGEYTQSSAEMPAWSILQETLNMPEYTISLKALKTGGVEGFLVPFAFENPGNNFWLNIGGWGNTQHAIEQAINRGRSTLVTARGSIEENKWYDIRVEVKNKKVACYLNDEFLFEYNYKREPVHASVVRDTEKNRLYVKMVNSSDEALETEMKLKGTRKKQELKAFILSGPNAAARNTLENPKQVVPEEQSFYLKGKELKFTLPAYSLVVFDLELK